MRPAYSQVLPILQREEGHCTRNWDSHGGRSIEVQVETKSWQPLDEPYQFRNSIILARSSVEAVPGLEPA